MNDLDDRSKFLRRLVVRGLAGGKRGHIGSSFSLIEILRILFDNFLNYRPNDPKWEGRDRFILSKGHGCLALYSLLVDKGFIPIEELDKFCEQDGILGGHPEASKIPGVEASTGALGHGLPIALGMALAGKIRKAKQRIVVVMGDGEINEGSVWESALHAGKHKLDNLSIFIDYNKLQSYGPTEEVVDLEPLASKWSSFGFSVRDIDGHDIEMLKSNVNQIPFELGRPSAMICHTVKGKGVPFAEGVAEWHHKSLLSSGDIEMLQKALEK